MGDSASTGQAPVDPQLFSKLPLTESFDSGYLDFNGVLPLDLAEGRLRVAVAGEPASEALGDLEMSVGVPLALLPVSKEELLDGVRRASAAAESVVELVKDLDGVVGTGIEGSDAPLADARDLANQPPVIRFVNLLIKEAHEARASDIHLESTRDGLHARFRIDGVLTDVPSPPKGLQAAAVSRVTLPA